MVAALLWPYLYNLCISSLFILCSVLFENSLLNTKNLTALCSPKEQPTHSFLFKKKKKQSERQKMCYASSILTILTATKTQKGKVWGGVGGCLLGFCCRSRHCNRCFMNVIWHIFTHRLLRSCCDPQSTQKETKAWRGWALPVLSPTVGTHW